jgi:hypothetical protein
MNVTEAPGRAVMRVRRGARRTALAMAVGAIASYYFDPDQGIQRRARLKSRLTTIGLTAGPSDVPVPAPRPPNDTATTADTTRV